MAELVMANYNYLNYHTAKKLPHVQAMKEGIQNEGFADAAPVAWLEVGSQEWADRWRVLSQANVAGNIRSFLLRLLHRRIPNLVQEWIAALHDRPASCLLCTTQAY